MADAATTIAEIHDAAASSLQAASSALDEGQVESALDSAERAVHVLRGLASVELEVRRMAEDWSRTAPPASQR